MQGPSCSTLTLTLILETWGRKNPNPNLRNPRKELKSFMKPQEDIECLSWEMEDGLSQIAVEKLNKNNFQVWKFWIMNF
jgi:hypothetical protein